MSVKSSSDMVSKIKTCWERRALFTPVNGGDSPNERERENNSVSGTPHFLGLWHKLQGIWKVTGYLLLLLLYGNDRLRLIKMPKYLVRVQHIVISFLIISFGWLIGYTKDGKLSTEDTPRKLHAGWRICKCMYSRLYWNMKKSWICVLKVTNEK